MPVPQSFCDIQELFKSIEKNPKIADEHVTRVVSIFFKKDPAHINRHFEAVLVDLACLGRTDVIAELKSRFLSHRPPGVQTMVCRNIFDKFSRRGLRVDGSLTPVERKNVFWGVCASLGVEHNLKHLSEQPWNNTRASLIQTFLVHQDDKEILEDLLTISSGHKILRNPHVLARLLHASTSPQVIQQNPTGYRRIGRLFSAHRLAEFALQTPRAPFIDLFLMRTPKEQKKIIEKCSGYKRKIEEFENIKQKNDLLETLQSVLDQKDKTPQRRM